MQKSRMRPAVALLVLTAINTLNFYDRQFLAAVAESVRHEWHLTDLQLGWLATAFILSYSVFGLPLGRLADIGPRQLILAGGLATWSIFTTLSGLSRSFWEFFALRAGLGIGEATCAPVSISLIGDLFKPARRGRALSVFMLGLPLGIALSYLAGGALAQNVGWRSAYILAGIPGMLLAGIVLSFSDPPRGLSESTGEGGAARPGSPWKVILSLPTMWWIILSGAVHNFNLYAISLFLPAFLIRYHQTTTRAAGSISAVVIGLIGGAGMLIGGWAGDRLSRTGVRNRMVLAASAALVSAPLLHLAMRQAPGDLIAFLVFLGAAWMLMYAYYPNVYSTIQDLLEPALRGTGTAIYFFAMYFLGALWGPVIAGWASDSLSRAQALQHGIQLRMGDAIPEQFRAGGLYHALGLTPGMGVLLALTLVAACLTVRRDVAKLRAWSGDFPRAGKVGSTDVNEVA